MVTNYIEQLSRLIANITESYSSVIFLVNDSSDYLEVAGHHTLSRDFIPDCKIPYGSGLVGWTAENGARISVCPFEHDASTLLYYNKDQLLKSFIAVPVLNTKQEVIGVIACDSKKSYAFAKITEKAMLECADLLVSYLQLKSETKLVEKPLPNETISLEKNIISRLKLIKNEDELLKHASVLAKKLVQAETLVIITTANNLHPAKFFCSEGDQKVQHHLMELVCRQKRILCGNKSVQSRPSVEPNAKPFLSVPFRVMDQEAGSFNLLGLPAQAFSANQISSLENIALAVGDQLERIRLRQRADAFSEMEQLISWNHFLSLGKDLINKANKNNESMALSRISFGNLDQLENLIGLSGCQELVSAIFRIIHQLIRHPAISCRLLGTEIVLFAEKSEVESVEHRLRKLLAKLDTNLDRGRSSGKPAISQIVTNGLKISTVLLNRDGKNIEELLSNIQIASKKTQVSNIYLNNTGTERQKAIA